MAKIIEDKEELKAVLEANEKVLVDFYADWCPPCRQLLPIIETLSEEQKDCTIVKVNTDNNPELKAEFEVQSIPTIILFEKGKPTKRNVGFIPKDELIEFIK